MPGEVIEGHAKFELDCDQCHQRFDKAAQTRLCLGCHKNVAADVRKRTRLHGRLDDRTCRVCHTEHKGRRAVIAPLDTKKFDHDQADFKLLGAHRDAKCETCPSHERSTVRRRGSARLPCEGRRREGAQGASREELRELSRRAALDDGALRPREDEVLVAGRQARRREVREVPRRQDVQNTPQTCNGCHRKDDRDRGHKGRYGVKCASCHNDRGWKEIVFNHDADTRYVLKGKHRPVACAACHVLENGGRSTRTNCPRSALRVTGRTTKTKGTGASSAKSARAATTSAAGAARVSITTSRSFRFATSIAASSARVATRGGSRASLR